MSSESAQKDSGAERIADHEFSANPLIYHLLVDRFLDAEPNRRFPFGREQGSAAAPGAFHGGTFSGITRKLRDGWFDALGINALLISPPYEQIHGWVPGGERTFRHYGYHGYFAADYTVTDPNFGSLDDLRELVECAHARGIRVLFDVALNHPGYPEPQSLADFGIDVLHPGWCDATPCDFERHIDLHNGNFDAWWGADWIRCALPGHLPGGNDDLTQQLHGLPDFRTESPAAVPLPEFLRRKADTRARPLPGATVREYLVHWLTAWVRELGIDGFRCDSARHVELESWACLKQAAVSALREWKQAHPEQAIDDAPFWMMGEVFDHGTERSAYFEHGFDSVLNFRFQRQIGDHAWLPKLYADYRRQLDLGGHQFVSYLSSHDTYLFPRHELARAATALMLAPGAVMLFYGDESGRQAWPAPAGDGPQATRSCMNWDSIEGPLLRHWMRLGQFRARNPALARGTHEQLGDFPYLFTRHDGATGNRVLVAVDAPAECQLAVPAGFAHAGRLYDAYAERWLPVVAGTITIEQYSPVILIASDCVEQANTEACV